MRPLPRCWVATALAGAIVAVGGAVWLVPGAWLATGAWAAASQSPVVHHVDDDPGCGGQAPCYGSIQAAVDAAADGDTVRVAPGRYVETVLVEDKGLAFEGPGAGDPDAPHQTDRHALWIGQSAAEPGIALLVDARGRDLSGLRVQGFRVTSATLGVLMLSRRAIGPWPLPPGRPAGPTDTSLRDVTVANNLFSGIEGAVGELSGAVVVLGAQGLRIADNQVRRSTGLAAWAGSALELSGNNLTDVSGPGLLVLGDGQDLNINGNVLTRIAGRGIEVRDLYRPSLAAMTRDLFITGNQVTDTAGEGIAVLVTAGGDLAEVSLAENRVTDAGAWAEADLASLLGGIALRAVDGRLADARLSGDVVRRTRRPGRSPGAGVYLEGIGGRLTATRLLVSDGQGPGIQGVDSPQLNLSASVVTRNQLGILLAETPGAASQGGALRTVLGGAIEAANRLGDNGGASLVLENRGAVQTPTTNVLATYNDWGAPYAPDIEALVRHEPDAAGLGRVNYLPAMGVPETMQLAAEPTRLVADGVSVSQISARVLDLAGLAVADGALVAFGSNRGHLARGGAYSEAEADDVSRLGQWTLYANQVFGPYRGSGYLRSRDPGARLVWAFDAPAVALSFGQGISGAGVFRAQVAGQDFGPFTTTGPDRSWAWRLLAKDLPPGPHTLTLTLESGELNVDALAAGQTSFRGQAGVQLRAASEPGLARLTATVVGAGGLRVAALDVPFTAGPPVSLRLTADRLELPVGGLTTTLTAEVRDSGERPVQDGTPVRFTVSEGSVSPAIVGTRQGRATAILSSGQNVGPALARAESGSASDSLELTYFPGPPGDLELNPSRASLAANSVATADLSVRLLDAWGHPVADGTVVTLTTTLGSLEAERLTTADGAALTRFRAGAVAGPALIRAQSLGASARATITLVAPDLRVTKWVEPRSVVLPGERVTYTLAVANVSTGTVYDAVITDTLPAGLLPGTVTAQGLPNLTDLGPPTFRWLVPRLRPGERGAITLTARIDPNEPWEGRTEIRNDVVLWSNTAAERWPADNVSSATVVVVPFASYTVTLTVPERLVAGGTTGPIQALVVDKEGRMAPDGTLVYFATDLGSVTPTVAPTQAGVARSTFVTGDRSGTAVVRAETQEERGASAYVRIAPGPAHRLDLVSHRDWLRVGGDETVITATLTDAYANPVTREPVLFTTTMGSFEVAGDIQSSFVGETNLTGVVTATLLSGARTGTAAVSAQNGMLRGRVSIPIRPGLPELVSIYLSRHQIMVGETVQVIGRVRDAYGNPVPGVPVTFASLVGQLAQTGGLTDGAGEERTEVTGTAPGFGMVSVNAAGRSAFTVLTVQQARLFLPAVMRPR